MKAGIGGIEQAFDMSDLHPGLFGTCDAYFYYPEERLLQVIDYKHGKGHFVKVENNSQLLYYALGALRLLNVYVEQIELVIVQPRCPRGGKVIHKWRFEALPIIFDFMVDLVRDAKRTAEPEAALKVGSWCYFCSAVSFCPEQVKLRSAKAADEFSDFEVSPVTENINN